MPGAPGAVSAFALRAARTREALALARSLGFAAAGVATVEPSRDAQAFRDWLAAGAHGSMAYLAEHVEVRLHAARVGWPGAPTARCAIMVADQYASRNDAPDEPAEASLRPRGRVARFARGRDYHATIKRRLHALCDALRGRFPGETFRAFVDIEPVLERELAARAGLGWQAKNTMLIHPRLGSYLLLGGVLTSLDLHPAHDTATAGEGEFPRAGPLLNLSRTPNADPCGTCTRCIDACPTRAITPYRVDASRCISYLTIERRGLPPTEGERADTPAVIDDPLDGLLDGVGDWLYGCDVCQEVCPHNSPRAGEVDVGEPNPAYEPKRQTFDLLDVLDWTEADRRREFLQTSMKRATLAMIKRNALVALGNLIAREAEAGTAADLPPRASAWLDRLRRAATDEAEPETVRRTARLVLSRLSRRGVIGPRESP